MISTCVLELGKTRYWYKPIAEKKRGTIVFVHGMTYPLEVWQPIQSTLAGLGWSSLSYDLYGRGQSEFQSGDLGVETLSHQLFQLLKHLEIAGAVHLVSLSNGDWIALDFAARHPERVASLSLIAPSGVDARTMNPWMRFFAKMTWLHFLVRHRLVERLCTRMLEHQKHLPIDSPESTVEIYRFARTCLRENPRFTAAFWSQVAHAPTETQTDSILARIHAGVAIRFFRFVQEFDATQEGVARFHQHPAFEEMVFQAGTHMALLEKPEVIQRALLDFWNG